MDLLRISTTTLDSFRLFCQPDQEWMSEDDLLATIRGEFTPTPQILLGRAFDAIITEPGKYKADDGYACEGFFFAEYDVDQALRLFDARGVFQVKGTKQYDDCLVVAKADQLIGSELIENKTTTSTFDFDKYAASCQWRFMTDIFEPTKITYHVFCLSHHPQRGTELRSIETFHLYPYAELHHDCLDLVRRFRRYVERKGLVSLLRERQSAALAVA